MLWIIVSAGVIGCIAFALFRILRNRNEHRQLELHSITADELHTLLASQHDAHLYDVRLPLDLLADAEVIPGAHRISPRDVQANPSLIPRDQDSIIYCTCPGEESSREVLERALKPGYRRIRFLKGGLAAWKARGYQVEPYTQTFHLDTADSR